MLQNQYCHMQNTLCSCFEGRM